MSRARHKPGTEVWKILKALQERDLTSEEIADLLGYKRKSMTTRLSIMKRKGLVRVSGRRKGEACKPLNIYSALVEPAEGEPEPEKSEPKEPDTDWTTDSAIEFLSQRGYRVIADPLGMGPKRGYLDGY